MPSQEILKIRDGTPLELDVPSNIVQKKRVARILVFKIRPSQEILKIRDGTPLEAEGILTYRKKPSKLLGLAFSNKLDVPSKVIQKKRVVRILVFKIRPSQEILKIRDGTPLEAEGILTYRKKPSKLLGLSFSNKLDVPSKVIQKKRVVRILVFKIRPSQEILKIRDGTPLEAEGILTYRKKPSKLLGLAFSNKLDVPSKVIHKKEWYEFWPSQEILQIRDGTPLEAEGILTYRKRPSKWLGLALFQQVRCPSNVVQKKRVVRILVFKIRPSQEILKIRDGTPLEAEGILTYGKKVARILVFKIRPYQEILQIRDGTPLEAEGILTYRKKPSKLLGLAFSNKLDVPSKVIQKKRVVRILVFKIRPSQEILKIRDGTPLEAEGILTYRKKPSKLLGLAFSNKLDVPSKVIHKKEWPSQEILQIRDGTPLEAEGILTYRKRPSKWLGLALFQQVRCPSNVVQKKRVVRILVFKIRPSQEILKIRDGTPLEAEGILTYGKKSSKLLEPSQEILQIRDGTPLEAEGILTYRKRPSKWLGLALFQQVRCPSNVVQKKRVVRILVFKIRPSQEILKIRDGTPLEKKRVVRILVFKIRPSQEILKIRDGTPLKAEGILTYRKKPSKLLGLAFSNKLDVPSKVIQKKGVARILVFKIRPYQEILQIRDGTPLEAEGILTYRKKPSKLLGLAFSNKLDVPSKVIQKKRVVRILVFKIRPSQEILKIRDGTPLEAEGILTYRKKPSKLLGLSFSNKLDVPSKVIQKKRVVRILVFKIRSSQEILKIRDGTPLEEEGILTYRKKPSKLLGLAFSNKLDVPSKMPSQEILQIRDGTPLEAEGILTYRKRPSKWLGLALFQQVRCPSNVVQKKRVVRILVFKIRPSQEILKIRDGTPLEMPYQEILQIRDGTPLEAEGILTYRKKPSKLLGLAFSNKLDVPSKVIQKKRVVRILVFKIRPSQEILKIRDGTPLEAEGILTYRKKPSKLLGLAFSNKLDVPSKVIQKKRVVRILVFKIRPSQEILKIRDGTPLEAEGILTYRKSPSKWPSQEILQIRDGTPLEAEGILTYRKRPSKWLGLALFQQVRCPSNVVQKKRVVRILVFKIRPSQEILKIRDGTPLEAEGILTYRKKPSKLLGLAFSNKLDVPSKVIQKKRVVRILVFKIRPSQEILKIRDGTPLEKKRVARILVFKIRPSQEILQIRDGTPLEAEGILTYRKRPSKWLGLALFQQVRCPSNVVQKKRVVRILVFKIRPSQEILKIRDGTPLEAEGILTYGKKVARILVFKIRPYQEILQIRDGTPLEAEGILTYRKKPSKLLGLAFSNKLDVPSKVIQKKRVVRILVFKIRPSQEILKIRDGTPLEAEGILTYRKSPSKLLGLAFSNKLDVPSKVIQKKRVVRILVFKIRPSQEILKIRDGTPLEAEGILTYRKSPSKWLVARILVFKIRPSQEILQIRDGTPLEAEGILTYRKRPSKWLGLALFQQVRCPSNVVQKKRVVRILVFKIRPSQEILKIRDGTPLEAEGILTYRKKPSKLLGLAFSNKLDVPSKVIQKKRVVRILVFKIRPSQEILKIRDGTPLKAEGILTYRKKPSKLLGLAFSNKLDVPSKVIQKKRVARILVFKIRPYQEILQIRDGTPLEAEGILTYRKKPSKLLGLAFSNKLDVPSKVIQKKRVVRILVFKIRPYQEILKIRDGTPLEAEGILTYRKKPSKLLGLAFSNKLDVPSKVIQKKRVVRILVFKIRPSQEILKIRDGTPLEAEGILTYRKKPSKLLGLAFSNKLDVPSKVIQKKRVVRILVLKLGHLKKF
ncbi:hypothetical protein OROMI_029188 [Orobanche minor]